MTRTTLSSDIILNDYFDWLYKTACKDRFSEEISYRKLFMALHNKVFRYSILNDGNRAEDGIDLRRRFAYEYEIMDDADEYLTEPCSVLEMILALSIRCEENIMDDPNFGDRTSQWFWGMISNLGLGSMTDDNFNKKFVNDILECFLDRNYEPDGKGGLFRIRNCLYDLRTVEIWVQLCWYLDSIT